MCYDEICMDTKALKPDTKPAEALKVLATNSERKFPVDEVKKALIRELEIVKVQLHPEEPENVGVKIFVIEALEEMLSNKRRDQWHLIRILQEIKQDYMLLEPR